MYYIIGGVIVLYIIIKTFSNRTPDPRLKLIQAINQHRIKSIHWTNNEITEKLTFLCTTVARIPRHKRNNAHKIMINGFLIGLTPKNSDMYDIRKLHDPKY